MSQIVPTIKRFTVALGQPGPMDEPLMVLRTRVEVDKVGKMTARTAKVDRTRTPQQMLDATGPRRQVIKNGDWEGYLSDGRRRCHKNSDVTEFIPRGEGETIEVIFFQLQQYPKSEELEEICGCLGLVPADLYSQAAVNEADPDFAATHPNCSNWKGTDGQDCYSAFGDGYVSVGRGIVHSSESKEGWWFAGIRK